MLAIIFRLNPVLALAMALAVKPSTHALLQEMVVVFSQERTTKSLTGIIPHMPVMQIMSNIRIRGSSHLTRNLLGQGLIKANLGIL